MGLFLGIFHKYLIFLRGKQDVILKNTKSARFGYILDFMKMSGVSRAYTFSVVIRPV